MQRTRMNGSAEQLQETSKQCKKGGMMGVVLKGGSNQSFPANSRSTATSPEHSQSPEPGNAPGIVEVQARGITTRTGPYFLIGGSCGIEIRHDVSKLVPDVGIGCESRRWRGRLDPATVEDDREVVFKVTCPEDRMLAPRHVTLHQLRDVIENLKHADQAVPARTCPAVQGIE